MASASLFLVATLFVFAVVQIGETRKCYHCSAVGGGDCDKPTESQIKECAPEQVCLTHNSTNAAGSQITRSCEDKSICAQKRIDLPTSTCIICDEDLCNSSSSAVPTFLIVGVVGLMFIKIFA